MPIFTEGQDPLDATYGPSMALPTPPAPEPPPSTAAEIGPAVAESFWPVALARSLMQASPSSQPVEGYNPVSRVVGTKYDPYLSQFLGDVNPDQTNARMLEIDHQEHNRDILARSGILGTAGGLATGAIDPFFWFIPGGELAVAGRMARGATLAARAVDAFHAPITGAEMLERMGVAGRAGLTAAGVGVATAGGEAIMQSVDPTHTWSESANAVASNALLAGVLGAAHGFLSAGEASRGARALEASRRDWAAPPGSAPPHPTSLAEPALEVPASAPRPMPADFNAAGEAHTTASIGGADRSVRWRLDPDTGAAEATHVDGRAIGEAQPTPIPSGEPAPVEGPRPAAGLVRGLGAATADVRTMELEPIHAFGLRNLVSTFGPEAEKWFDRGTTKNGWLSPVARMFGSDRSLPGKQAAGDLVDTGLHFTQERQGVPAARGGMTAKAQADLLHDHYTGLANGILQTQFAKHRGVAPGVAGRLRATAEDVRGQAQGKLTYPGFKTEVSKALLDGGSHAMPEVAETAGLLNKHVFDPVKTMLQGIKDSNGEPILGELTKAPKGDLGFLPRFYLKKAMAADPAKFDSIVSSWLEREQGKKIAAQRRLSGLNDRLGSLTEKMRALEKRDTPEAAEERSALEAEHAGVRKAIEEEIGAWEGKSSAEAKAALKAREKYEAERSAKVAAGAYKGEPERLTSADSAVDRSVKRILEDWKEMSPQEIGDRARQIRNRIDTDPEGRLPYDEPKADANGGYASSSDDFRGSLNARAFAIPTKDMLPFVNTDLDHVIPAYLRNVIPDALLVDRFGDIRMTEVLKRIDEDYGRRMAGKTTEEQAALEAQRKAEKGDIAAMRDRYRGVYGMPTGEFSRNLGRAARAFGQYNAITMLGSSVLNRLQDSVSAVSRRGMLGYMRDGVLPYIRGMHDIYRGIDTADAQTIGMIKSMRIGVATELNHIASSFGDIVNDHMPGNRFERTLQAASRGAMVVNLHGPWTDVWQRIPAMAAMFDNLGMAERIAKGTGSERDVRMLAYYGIDRPMTERIWNEFQAHHTEINGRMIPNIADWNENVATAFTNALRKEASLAVARPGQETPNWMATPIGAAVGQFRSFEFAAWHRLMISNLQMSDANALQGMFSMVGAGMLSYWLYSVASGRKLSENPQDWVKEGLIRSGIMGPFSTMNTLQAKLTAGKTDLFRAIGAGRAPTRRDQTNVIEDALGPTLKEIMGLGMTIPRAFNGTLSAHDLNNARQTFIPLQNLMFFRQLLDMAEDGLARHMGIKPLNRNPTQYPGIWSTPQ